MKRVIGICLMAFVIAVFMIPNFAHADSFNFTVEANKYEVRQGETVTLSLKLSNIDAGELGINVVEGKLSYDEKVFEKVSKSSFKGLNEWEIKYNDEETEEKGKFVGVLLQIGTKGNQEIGQIKLKAKENIDVSATTIKVTDIATNNGKDLIKDRDKEINLKIAKENNDEQGESENNSSDNNYIINNEYIINNIYYDDNNDNSNNNPNNSIIGKIKETAKNIDLSKLPETGTGRMIIYVIIIVLLIIINLLISYVTTGKKKKKKKIIK